MPPSSTGSILNEPVLVFDIETIPLERRRSDLSTLFIDDRSDEGEPPDVASKEADIKTYLKDQKPCIEIMQAMLENERKGKNRTGVCNLLSTSIRSVSMPIPKKYAVLPEMQRVVCIGMADTSTGKKVIVFDQDGDDQAEVNILEEFWSRVKGKIACGWGIQSFDLPVILLASKRLGIEAPVFFDLKRSIGFIDLMRARFGHDLIALDKIAVASGFPLEMNSLDPLKYGGSEVHQAWLEGRNEAIAGHCSVDLERTLFMFELYKELFV